MSDNKIASEELVHAVLKEDGIAFRGITIGDNLETVVSKEGKSFEDRGGSLPNYKYFIELGEMEELELVYAYHAETKAVYSLEVTLKTFPKHYWKEAGGTDLVDFNAQLLNNTLKNHVRHFSDATSQILAHFENQLGSPGIGRKDYVHDQTHHNFIKNTWISDNMRLTMMSFINDTNYPRSSVNMELVLLLTEI